jgi:hypothetical protein
MSPLIPLLAAALTGSNAVPETAPVPPASPEAADTNRPIPAAPVSSLPAAPADLPPGITAERYRPLWERSPFTLPSANTNVVVEAAPKLALIGIGKIGDEPYVSVFNKETQVTLFIGPKGSGGFTIASVDLQPKLTESSVTLKQGAETLVVKADPALMAIPSANAPKPPTVAAAPAVPPLPLPPGSPGVSNPLPPGTPPPPAIQRSRRRVIVPPPAQ